MGVQLPQILTEPRTEFDHEIEERLDTIDADDDFTGWWCVSTNPFPCPAEGCGFIALFLTAAHRIIVWAERDDPRLLSHAGRAQSVDRNPRVVSYERGLGPCISYDSWEAIGRPVHAVAPHPRGGW